MTPERWRRIEELYHAALERPEEQRSAFLDEACGGDQELRREVESLLRYEQVKDSLLDRPQETPAEMGPRLAAGAQLGPYRIEAYVGAGGMGEVYRAYDPQLRRPVALKVLPPEYTSDPGRRKRLLREARAASALSHPNIIGIHEVGSDAGVDFIAMEFVEGKSLAGMIPAKGLPLDRALDYGIQIASGLAKAHAAGVVHRDLKPGNIMVTQDGLVKLLDFGLARRVEVGEVHDTSLTVEGEILGTPSYMSPEQAQGKPAGARSDVFSFGAVLYEMLTGRRAFTGDSVVAILGAVLREEPPPLAGVPPELEKLVHRCLRKDPARRLQHMGDVKLVLEDLKEEVASRRPGPVPVTGLSRWRKPVWVAALAVLVAAAGLTLAYLVRHAGTEAGQMRVVPLTSYPGSELYPTFSPDGNQVAFSWNGEKRDNFDIYVKLVGSGAPPLRLTTDPAIDTAPAWSPDGRQIAFLRSQGQQASIYLVPPLGGWERKLADCQLAGRGVMSWSPDGKWLAVPERDSQGNNGIFLTPVERGEKRRLTSNRGYIDHFPAFSPDGRFLAYASCTDLYACDVHLLELGAGSLPRGQPRRLTHQGVYIQGIAWVPDGRSLVYSASQSGAWTPYLWRVSVSTAAKPERLELAGPRARCPAISRAGNRLAYSRGGTDPHIWKFEAGAPAKPFISSTLLEWAPQFSPDGRRIAFSSDRTGLMEVWVVSQDGSNPVQLTDATGRYQGTPRWSPDGRWIAFDSQGEDGHWGIYVIDPAGGQPRQMIPRSSDGHAPIWSRDGRWIYFASNRSGRFEIWRVPGVGGKSVQVTDNGGFAAFESWDGRALYFQKSREGTAQPLFAKSLAGGAERQVLDSVITRAFSVVEDGIYHFAPADENQSYPLQFFDFGTGKTRVLTRVEATPLQGLTVSPDRKTVLFGAYKPVDYDLMLIDNFR